MNTPNLHELIDIVKRLRDPVNGCPWDKKQTHSSLLQYLTEEGYEFIQAVEDNDTPAMVQELGDVLLQILLHSTIGEQAGKFNLEDVAKACSEKMIRRHPHIFNQQDGPKNINSEQVVSNWEQIKEQEKGDKEVSTFDDSYHKFPALISSFKIGKKTNHLGFDWENPTQVLYKVEEEWQELKEEIYVNPDRQEPVPERVAEELGDLLFSVAQLARHLKLNPEDTLRQANKKFIKRFSVMEEMVKKDNKKFSDLGINQLEDYWNQAKKICNTD